MSLTLMPLCVACLLKPLAEFTSPVTSELSY